MKESEFEKLRVWSNPGSRRVPLGDDFLMNAIYRFHQVSPKLLLIELRAEGKKDWALYTTDGKIEVMSKDLKEALKEGVEVESFCTFSNRC